MKNLVTIVVPVYNAEKYIEKCIQSILNQTYKNIELILINDGSTDSSLKIMKEYEKKNKSIIRLYDNENHGVSFTRNFGLEKATGEYITFIDSDDYIDDNFIEILVNNIEDNDAIFSGHKVVNSKYKIVKNKRLKNGKWAKYKYCSTCSKLYTTDFLKNNKISYPQYKIGEDIYFNCIIVSTTKKIKPIDYSGYNYYNNETSATHNVKKIELMELYEELIDELKKRNIFNKDKYIAWFLIKTYLFSLIIQLKNISIEEANKKFNNLIKWLKNEKFKIKILHCKGEELPIILITNMFIIGYYLKINKLLISMLKRIKF